MIRALMVALVLGLAIVSVAQDLNYESNVDEVINNIHTMGERL